MIKTLEIQNFKSHKKTILELSPGVNVIVGSTDSGKSAIIQALRWLITNRPSGDSFRSSWENMGTVCGVVLDGADISRIKTNAENMYRLDSLDFRAIGTEIPEEIRKILNLNEINLQTQFESHFLLSRSAGEVASHFNKIAHLDKIDVGMANIQRGLRTVQQDIKSYTAVLEAKEAELKEYDYLTDLEGKIEELEYVTFRQQKLVDRLAKGRSLEEAILDLNTQIGELEDIIPLEKTIDHLLEIDTEMSVLKMGKATLSAWFNSYEKYDEEEKEAADHLEQLEEEFHKHIGEGKICPLCGNVITQ